jgi:CRISPR/Cas system-associated endonuclease/helicase Cas3
MKRFFLYLKFYSEPSKYDVQKLATKSWREYAKANPSKRYDMTFCQNYLAGYEKHYRTAYANTALESINPSKGKINK